MPYIRITNQSIKYLTFGKTCCIFKALEQGKSKSEVSRLFGVSRQALYNWLDVHQSDGLAGLRAKEKGRPKGGGKLSAKQESQLVNLITDRLPDQLKLPFYLWTREAVVELIERKFDVALSVWTVGRLLKRWGFTPQKPVRQAFEKNPEAVQEWLDQTYPGIVRQAKHQKAEIYWGDEMGLRSDHQAGRSFAPRGQTPVIPGTGQRFGCNMISALTNKGRLLFMVFKHRFTAPVFVAFLKRLLRQANHKVFLIVDGHPVHKSRTVQNFLHQNKNKITLIFLPPYSPDLNPDELVNQDVKSNALGRSRPRNQ